MSNDINSKEQNSVAAESPMKNEGKPDEKPVDEKEEIKKKATLLLLQGKRSIFIRDYQAAVAALSESCQLFSQIFDELDEGLADPYFYYGKALLEVGRSESEVLGDQVQDENEDDDEEEEEEEEDGEKAEAEPNEQNGENGVSSGTENAEQNGEKEDEAAKENTEPENDDVNDLQLSWEYLELAKLIYLKKADTCTNTAVKLAETYLCLGENGLESENYSIAVEDIKQALDLQIKHLKKEDRRIAETYYQLGVAYSLAQNYDEAITSFKKAIEQLGFKIESLETRKKMGDKKTEEEEKDAFYTMDGEITEIKGVIKDIEEKIKDMVESKQQMKAELMKQVCGGERQDGSSTSNENAASSSSSIPATDISHLVRKKRKNEESETNPEKKSKSEN